MARTFLLSMLLHGTAIVAVLALAAPSEVAARPSVRWSATRPTPPPPCEKAPVEAVVVDRARPPEGIVEEPTPLWMDEIFDPPPVDDPLPDPVPWADRRPLADVALVRLQPPDLTAPTPSTLASDAAPTEMAALVPPSPITADNPPPHYPRSARRKGHEGTVVIEVLVGREGAAESCRVARSSGHAELDEAALRAVEGWRFVAATRGSTPIEAWLPVTIQFRLRD